MCFPSLRPACFRSVAVCWRVPALPRSGSPRRRWPLFIGYHALRAATRRVSCFIRRAVVSRPLAPDPRRRDDADRTRVSQDLRTFLNWPAAPRPRSPPLQPRTRPRSLPIGAPPPTPSPPPTDVRAVKIQCYRSGAPDGKAGKPSRAAARVLHPRQRATANGSKRRFSPCAGNASSPPRYEIPFLPLFFQLGKDFPCRVEEFRRPFRWSLGVPALRSLRRFPAAGAPPLQTRSREHDRTKIEACALLTLKMGRQPGPARPLLGQAQRCPSCAAWRRV